jgi:hypothetical protein
MPSYLVWEKIAKYFMPDGSFCFQNAPEEVEAQITWKRQGLSPDSSRRYQEVL